jgi:hypothetical protein
MGLFNFFSKKEQPVQPENSNGNPEIPQEFLTTEGKQQETTGDQGNGMDTQGIEAIYSFLQGDYESKGYDDALTNPDDSYKSDNIKLIKLDLQILIQKVNTYYEDLAIELDLHIATRSRAGLVDLVQELESRKQMVVEHQAKVGQMQAEIENENGMSRRIILSYQRGFMRGLSALTQSKVLNKKI